MTMRTRWALVWVVLGLAGAAVAASVDGVVTQVIDGDSVVFAPAAAGAAPLEARLLGIDAPEGCQPGGDASRQALAAYVSGKPATLKIKGKDTYQRTLGTVFVDGVDINARMVADGHAWSARYKGDKGPYIDKERLAQSLRRGVHATAGAVMPRDFRRTHGRCEGSAAIRVAPPAGPRPHVAPAGAAAAARADPPVAGSYRCDGRTRCAQMRSCEEATWFLQHCPGVTMDGNRDGVPCEAQWCR